MNQFENMICFFRIPHVMMRYRPNQMNFLKNNLKLNYCFLTKMNILTKKCDPVKKCCNLINYKEETNNIYDLLAKKLNLK